MADDEWWYNTRTGEVEHGAQSPWSDRAGPYKTEAEAKGAPDRLKANSQKWASEDS
jgi:hypothetical protein